MLPEAAIRALGLEWSVAAIWTMRGILCVIAVVVFVVQFSENRRKNAKLIADLKDEVSQLRKEREVLIAEIEGLKNKQIEGGKFRVVTPSEINAEALPVLEALSKTPGVISFDKLAKITKLTAERVRLIHTPHLVSIECVKECTAQEAGKPKLGLQITEHGRALLEIHRQAVERLSIGVNFFS